MQRVKKKINDEHSVNLINKGIGFSFQNYAADEKPLKEIKYEKNLKIYGNPKIDFKKD